MVDSPGDWGALKVVDVTDPASPTLRGTYRPPGATVFPPPDLGVYAVHHAVARGPAGFVAGHANGLRVIDLTSANPTELASFVPPDVPDPTHEIPNKADVVGVDVAANGSIVISDVNYGLYVLKLRGAPQYPQPPQYQVPPPPPPPPGVVARKGKLSAKVTPSKDVRAPFRFATSGKLTLPSGVTKAAGCTGKVRVRVKRGTKTISTKTVSLKSSCTYKSKVSFANRRKFPRAKRLKFSARFLGNTRVLPVNAPTRFGRVRN